MKVRLAKEKLQANIDWSKYERNGETVYPVIGLDGSLPRGGILARINILVLLRKGNPVAIRDQDSYAAIWERCARTDFRIRHSR